MNELLKNFLYKVIVQFIITYCEAIVNYNAFLAPVLILTLITNIMFFSSNYKRNVDFFHNNRTFAFTRKMCFL